MKSWAYQTTPTQVLAFLPSLLARKTSRPHDGLSHLSHLRVFAVSQLRLGHIDGAWVVDAHHHGLHIHSAGHSCCFLLSTIGSSAQTI